MSDFVNFELDLSERGEDWFAYAGFRSRDMRDPLTQVGHSILSRVNATFATEGAALLGEEWEELSPGYAEWKEKVAPGKPILQLSRELYREAIDDSNVKVHRTDLFYEVPLARGKWHNDGDPFRMAQTRSGDLVPNPLPQREWFEWDDVMAERAENIFNDWLEGLRRRNTRR